MSSVWVGLLGIGLLMYTPSPLYLAALHSIARAHASVLVSVPSMLLVAGAFGVYMVISALVHIIGGPPAPTPPT